LSESAAQVARRADMTGRAANHRECAVALLASKPLLAWELLELQKGAAATTSELAFVDDAVDSLLRGRAVCAWSYAHILQWPDDRSTALPLFQLLQSNVEGCVEMLAALLLPQELALVRTGAASEERATEQAQERLMRFRVRVSSLTAAMRSALARLAEGVDEEPHGGGE
jgi:hypothetical protein